MNFITKISLRLLAWAVIFGFISGIFGIALSLIQITNFYLSEGTQQVSDSFIYRIENTSAKPLKENALEELRNIEGIAFVDPFFNPTNEIIGSINYFGFSASQPVVVHGIPKRIGIERAVPAYRQEWNSADLSVLPVLLPRQAITLYNNIAPQRGWPTLTEDSFIALPGISLKIASDEVRALITGFEPDKFGAIVSAPSEKLYAIYNELGLDPHYDYVILESVPGITVAQNRSIISDIQSLGYQTRDARELSFQQGLFIRIRYTIIAFTASILFAFVLLLYYNIINILRPMRDTILLHRIWAVGDNIAAISVFFTVFFGLVSGVLAWFVSFFAVIPAQDYIVSTISQLGINAPPVRDSAIASLYAAGTCIILFISVNIATIAYFFIRVPKASYIKKF